MFELLRGRTHDRPVNLEDFVQDRCGSFFLYFRVAIVGKKGLRASVARSSHDNAVRHSRFRQLRNASCTNQMIGDRAAEARLLRDSLHH